MRVKQIWAYIPLPAKLKLVWDRFTFSRLTTFYIIFSVLHCIIQVAFQVKAFTINAAAASFLYSVLIQGNASNGSFPILGNDLRMCDEAASNMKTTLCRVIWSPVHAVGNISDNQQAQANNPLFDVTSAASTAPASFTPSSSTSISSSSATSLSAPASSLSSTTTFGQSNSQKASSTTSQAKVTVTIVVQPSVAAVDNNAGAHGTQLTSTSTASPSSTIVPVANNGDEVEDDDDDDDEDEDEDEEYYSRTSRRGLTGEITATRLNNGTVQVQIQGFGFNTTKDLDKNCLWALNWPVSVLDNTKREDIVFISFQFWVLGMSVVALLNESIPHILASLLTHILATSWAGFQIYSTASFRANFTNVITKGACSQAGNLLPHYWQDRGDAEIPSLALNIAALFISSFLTWRLIKLFGWQTFKRVGASLTINRVYKIVLTLSITIQLSLFFMVVTVALWIDQLFNGFIGVLATLSTLYKVTFTITLVLLVPWLATGWFAVRRERKALMAVFLVLCAAYLGGWGAMFGATTFRWTFITWRFFAVMASASVALTLVSFILGIICRMNFGKGLSRYLNAQGPLDGDDFVPFYPGDSSDPEKVDFPSNEKPIPTYSATFGSGAEVPPPTQMFGTRLGPRFFNSSAEPFETQSNASSLTAPSPVLTRVAQDEPFRGAPLMRRDTRESEKSFASQGSEYSHYRSDSQTSGQGTIRSMNKRWVIE